MKKKSGADEAKHKIGLKEEEVSLSLIIPTHNCAERIEVTLSSIKSQKYQNLEVIVVDAGSTDHTLKIINRYMPMVSRVYAVASYDLPQMINRGIALASGRYLTLLYPGSFYLSQFAFNTFAKAAQAAHLPEVIYAGVIQRQSHKEPEVIYAPFQEELLKKGVMPTAVVGCWFREDLFETVGKLNPLYRLRGGFDFFCRVARSKEIRIEALDRVFVDFDLGAFTYLKALSYAAETWRILRHYYGVHQAFLWFLTIDHRALVKVLANYFKQQIFSK